MNLQVTVHTDWNTIEPLHEHWSEWAGASFMADWRWLRAWWEAYSRSDVRRFEPRRQLAVCSVGDSAGKLLGIGPFYVSTGIANRTLRLLGDGQAASDYVGILAAPREMDAVTRTIANWLHSADFRQQFGGIDLIECDGQRNDAPWIGSFIDELQHSGWRAIQSEQEGAWQIDLPSDWSTYLRQLNQSHRRKVKKIAQQVSEGSVQVEWIDDVRKLDTWWPRFVALHQRRRHELGQPGCFTDPKFDHFLGAAVEAVISKGEAAMLGATVAGRAIACGLFFCSTERWSLYQCGMNSRYESYQPGHLINALAIEAAIQRGARVFDFLRGDEPYKRLWRTQRVPLFRWRIVAPQWQSRLKHSAWLAARQIKRASQLIVQSMQTSRTPTHVPNSNHPVID
ncbi:MAG TPA: GNAT family N-acetyltransferase [Pirellulaceae bacterium]|nr:GNAT family N-acetyltransferase [Pirellulaceae bacterium]